MAERPGAEPSWPASARKRGQHDLRPPRLDERRRAARACPPRACCAGRGCLCVLRSSRWRRARRARSADRRMAWRESSGFSTRTRSSARRRSLTKRVSASRTRAVSAGWMWNSSSRIAIRRGAGRRASTATSFCTTPSSRSSKSFSVRPVTGLPARSVTTVEIRTVRVGHRAATRRQRGEQHGDGRGVRHLLPRARPRTPRTRPRSPLRRLAPGAGSLALLVRLAIVRCALA